MKFPTFSLLNLALTVAPLWQLQGAAAHKNCKPDQDTVIDKAFAEFHPLARGMAKSYAASTATPPLPAAVNIFKRWFGDISQATPHNRGSVNQILLQLAEIAKGNKHPDFYCLDAGVPSCAEPGTYGYTLPGDPTINLCPHFFQNPNLDLSTLQKSSDPVPFLTAGGLTHEFTHSRALMGIVRPDIKPEDPFKPGEVYTPGGAKSETYGKDDCLKLAKTPDAAIRNADNYRLYTQEAYRHYCCSVTLDMNGNVPTADKQDICGQSGILPGSGGWNAMLQSMCSIL